MAAVDGAIVRSAEWRRVRAFATPGPGQARPSLLAVSGEAGAGKSTLWRAGVEAAAPGRPARASQRAHGQRGRPVLRRALRPAGGGAPRGYQRHSRAAAGSTGG